MSRIYLNENDPEMVIWLKNLVVAGELPKAEIDDRSIVDVIPSELTDFDQCHFFAGVGIWPLAFQIVGWPDHLRTWSGSCPCQPFSSAGKGLGFLDPRHLWPDWFWSIGHVRPDVVVGEQVASKDGLAWLDIVQADMERARYAFGATDTCAAGYGAPHIRQRLYWLGHADRQEFRGRSAEGDQQEAGFGYRPYGDTIGSSGLQLQRLADAERNRRQKECSDAIGRTSRGRPEGVTSRPSFGVPHDERLADANGEQHDGSGDIRTRRWAEFTNRCWSDVQWLQGSDGPWRPVEPGTFPLAHGDTTRVVKIRAYGNAIVLSQAITFLEAAKEILT